MAAPERRIKGWLRLSGSDGAVPHGRHRLRLTIGGGTLARPESIVSDISLYELLVHGDQVAATVNTGRGY